MQQCDQDKGSGPGLVGYMIWKSDTNSEVWVSSDMGIHSDVIRQKCEQTLGLGLGQR